MIDALDELFEKIGDDPELRRAAVAELAWMLEESTERLRQEADDAAAAAAAGARPPSLLERELTEDVFAPRLDRAEQVRIVDRLRAWAVAGDVDEGVFPALAAALPEIGMPAVLSVLAAREPWLTDELRLEALAAIRRLLARGEDGRPLDEVVQALRRHSPLPFALACQESPHPELAEEAHRTIRDLGLYRHI